MSMSSFLETHQPFWKLEFKNVVKKEVEDRTRKDCRCDHLRNILGFDEIDQQDHDRDGGRKETKARHEQCHCKKTYYDVEGPFPGIRMLPKVFLGVLLGAVGHLRCEQQDPTYSD